MNQYICSSKLFLGVKWSYMFPCSVVKTLVQSSQVMEKRINIRFSTMVGKVQPNVEKDLALLNSFKFSLTLNFD